MQCCCWDALFLQRGSHLIAAVLALHEDDGEGHGGPTRLLSFQLVLWSRTQAQQDAKGVGDWWIVHTSAVATAMHVRSQASTMMG